MPHVRSASIGIWTDVGSSAESDERRGISHLVEHMMFKGTQRRTARQIAEEMDGVGGNLNAFTDKELTCYYAKVIDRHVPLAVDVLTDMFLHSTFDPAELAKEQRVVLEEIKMYDDSPDEVVHDLFTRTMWKGSHLGEPTIGYAHTVSSFTRDDLKRHMQVHYAPTAVVVAVAGNIEHESIVDLFTRAFDGFEGQAQLPVPDRPAATPSIIFKYKDVEQAYVCLGTSGLSTRDDRRYVLSVLDTILGGGMSSRLFQEIREKRGLAYSVYSFQQAYREAGLFGIYAGTSPEKARECVELVIDQCEGLASKGVGPDELHLAKEHMKGNLTLALESTSSRMIRLGRNEFSWGRQVTTEEIEQRIDAVTLEDVAHMAHEMFARDRFGLCVLGAVDEFALDWDTGDAAVA